jgi:drug/metabolite transporter (DMT)-like permease
MRLSFIPGLSGSASERRGRWSAPAARAVAWMVAAQAFFSFMAVGARMVSRGVAWQEVCAIRMLVALVLAYALARARGASLAITDRKYAWLRSIFGTLAAAGTFWVYAQPRLALGDAVTLFQTTPLFVALFSWPLLRERVRRSVLAAMVCGFAGIVVVAQPSFATAAPVLLGGTLTAIASALAMMWLRRIGPAESSEAIVFHFMAVGTVTMLLASLPVWRTPGGQDLVFLLLTGLAGGLGQLALTRAYGLDSAARVAAIGYTQIVFTRLLAFPFFAEVPTAVQLGGSALVIASGVALALRPGAKLERS